MPPSSCAPSASCAASGSACFQYRDISAMSAPSRHAVNAFLREIAPSRISLKDFRTLMASAVVLEIAVAYLTGGKRPRPPQASMEVRCAPRRR